MRPATPADLRAVVSLLADAFAISLRQPRYSQFLQRQVTTYCTVRLQTPRHQAALLVATTADEEQPVAVCEVSVSAMTRSFADQRLAPPPRSIYVSNVSVLPTVRRRGIGTALLNAAQAYAIDAMQCSEADAEADALLPLEVFLHCVLDDDAAYRLYSSAGFVTVAQHAPWELPLFRQGAPRMRLLRKSLAARQSAGRSLPFDKYVGRTLIH